MPASNNGSLGVPRDADGRYDIAYDKVIRMPTSNTGSLGVPRSHEYFWQDYFIRNMVMKMPNINAGSAGLPRSDIDEGNYLRFLRIEAAGANTGSGGIPRPRAGIEAGGANTGSEAIPRPRHSIDKILEDTRNSPGEIYRRPDKPSEQRYT